MTASLRRLFAFAYAAGLVAVTVVSLVPAPQVAAPPGSDKLAHFLAYGAVALCAGLGFAAARVRLAAGGAAFVLGIALEIAQGFLPTRTASAYDALANGVGVVTGLAAAALLVGAVDRWRARPR